MRTMSVLIYFLVALLHTPLVAAVRMIESNALALCSDSSNFTATYFHVRYTPDNNSLVVGVDGVSAISGFVEATIVLDAYGYTALRQTFNPCDNDDLEGLCPMNTGQMKVPDTQLSIGSDLVSQIPGIAFTVPDLDATVRIYINSTTTHESITCLQATLSNGKTVYQKGVGWTTAIIAGLGLTASAITSGLGHSNTAAHIAANALSLFTFYQSQAMIGMTSIHMPPIVQSWTQNFQWSMGIIRIGFLQDICTWYQRSTGGTAATILSELSTTSVTVLKKRSFDAAAGVVGRSVGALLKRDEGERATSETTELRGIERVGFIAGMEATNIFLTGFIFFVVFVALVMLLVVSFKGACELLAKHGKMKSDKFQDFRHGWRVVTRGILFRLTLIGFPQMCILCLWEFTRNDSPAEVVLAVIMLVSLLAALGWASFKVISLAKRSIALHKNPAYILYSDPTCLNKWGFLYVQYRATAYYFVIPVLGYLFVKAMFIGLSQPAPVVQTVAYVILEAGMLIAVSVLRPWMDKKTNIYNISIAAVQFLNAIFLLFFSNVFNQPGLVTGVMGVVFFVINAVAALVLLILVLIASIYAMVSKNPDTRYQPMRDDRGSFIKSQTQLTTELDALGATARGDMKSTTPYKSNPFDDENSSFSSGNGASVSRQNLEANPIGVPNQQAHSPVDPSLPLFPSDNSGPRGPGTADNIQRSQSPIPRSFTSSPYRTQNSQSPWQRGAGYEH
ncbi:hypothetical protein BJX76DRAFT_342177 [Aspergillus varians]